MDKDSPERGQQQVSSFMAVLLGALAPGVNGPTWNALKATFLMLGVCLALMLGFAFAGGDPWLTVHVVFLVAIAGGLFALLSWFTAQTGLVSIEHQMKELDLVPDDLDQKQKLK
ncbi:hypothetical protein MLD38_037042 [Melastoma candidum]|uniref:Uncharacterized protein n=1 Tax=Melastoma candidum TaxID=119954 RepID=A0ACB9LMJ3_9MYRT|nr:hypothetical protein MLD38_037042 [Melastoma candidum]